jgi:uncharacterized membrane protein YkoI
MVAVLAAVLSAGALAAGARPALAGPSAAAPSPAARPAPQMTMDQAVKLVEQRFRARVVRAETRRQGNRTIYVLRLLDDAGRVFTVRVDAASGSII